MSFLKANLSITGGTINNTTIGATTPSSAAVTTLSSTQGITISTGQAIKTTTTASDTLSLQAYDTDGAAYFTFATLTAGVVPTFDITSPNLITPILGTPSSGTLTNCTGLPVAGLSNLGTNVGTFLTTPSSANLASAVTGETGSGALVFGTSPTLQGTVVVSGGLTLTSTTQDVYTVTTPTGGFSAASSIINKEYVDSVASGLDPKGSVLTATVSDLNTELATNVYVIGNNTVTKGVILNVSGGSGTWTIGETVTEATSGATGVLRSADNLTAATSTVIYLSTIGVAAFTGGLALSGNGVGTSAATSSTLTTVDFVYKTTAGAIGTIDGQTVVLNSRILVKNQTTTTQNGIYIVALAGSVSIPFILKRSSDQDGSPASEVSAGNYVFVEQGTEANAGWVLQGTGILTLNTDAIVWTQFSTSGLSGSGVDNEITRWNGTGALQSSSIVISDTTASTNLSLSRTVTQANADFTISLLGAFDASLVLSSAGTGADAVQLTASAGGMAILAAAGKALTIGSGTVAISSLDNSLSAVAITTNVGTTETIVVTNTQGTNTAAINLTSTVGGVSITSGLAARATLFPSVAGTGAEIRLYEGANYTGVKASNALTGDTSFILPSAAGSASDILYTTDGTTFAFRSVKTATSTVQRVTDTLGPTNITGSNIVIGNTSGNTTNVELNLQDGTVDGERKYILYEADGATSRSLIVHVAAAAGLTNSLVDAAGATATTLTFDTIGQSCIIVWSGTTTKWYLANAGVTIA